jgi:hypothetical protein
MGFLFYYLQHQTDDKLKDHMPDIEIAAIVAD